MAHRLWQNDKNSHFLNYNNTSQHLDVRSGMVRVAWHPKSYLIQKAVLWLVLCSNSSHHIPWRAAAFSDDDILTCRLPPALYSLIYIKKKGNGLFVCDRSVIP